MIPTFYRQVIVLVVLIVLLCAVSLIAKYGPHRAFVEDLGRPVPALPVPPPPPMTETMKAVLEKSKGFSAFVSYTDNGFEPSDVRIAKGQTIRFTNNSSRPLWISAVVKDGLTYPLIGESCSQSSFDTCVAMPPYEIWEFTFTEPGAWGYRNNGEQTHTGVVRVK